MIRMDYIIRSRLANKHNSLFLGDVGGPVRRGLPVAPGTAGVYCITSNVAGDTESGPKTDILGGGNMEVRTTLRLEFFRQEGEQRELGIEYFSGTKTTSPWVFSVTDKTSLQRE